VARADRRGRAADLPGPRRRPRALRDRRGRRQGRARRRHGADRRTRARAHHRTRRGGHSGRGPLPARLARAASLLRPVRIADRDGLRRLEAKLSGVPRLALPAHGSRRDHAGHARRAGAARPQPAAPRRPVLVPRRLRRAGRDAGGGRAPRGARGSRRPLRARALPGRAAVAVSVELDDGISHRGPDRGDHRRRRGDRRGALVLPRRDPRDGGAGRHRPRRSHEGVAIAHQICRRWSSGLDGV